MIPGGWIRVILRLLLIRSVFFSLSPSLFSFLCLWGGPGFVLADWENECRRPWHWTSGRPWTWCTSVLSSWGCGISVSCGMASMRAW